MDEQLKELASRQIGLNAELRLREAMITRRPSERAEQQLQLCRAERELNWNQLKPRLQDLDKLDLIGLWASV